MNRRHFLFVSSGAAAGSIVATGFPAIAKPTYPASKQVKEAQSSRGNSALLPEIDFDGMAGNDDPGDTYEHAFFFDYENRKKEYIERFMDHIDWREANRRFAGV